ncbi:MAG: hypothetical protein EOM12_18015 [Verrucomicrobiae bacterium]|nr:hypothetical protein [Verrucomicrobiae bacterium]
MWQPKKLDGLRFGRLVVIERQGKHKDGNLLWLCKCDCGNTVVVCGKYLRCGDTKSCGCLNIEKIKERFTTHGAKRNRKEERLHRIWSGMKARCEIPSATSFKYYGGKGISVCAEWKTYQPFKEWALQNGYENHLTIDRLDNEKGYSPSNCRWATTVEQHRNQGKRRCK